MIGRFDRLSRPLLRALDPESFTEVLNAVGAHDDAMEKERVAEKNAQAGAIAS